MQSEMFINAGTSSLLLIGFALFKVPADVLNSFQIHDYDIGCFYNFDLHIKVKLQRYGK